LESGLGESWKLSRFSYENGEPNRPADSSEQLDATRSASQSRQSGQDPTLGQQDPVRTGRGRLKRGLKVEMGRQSEYAPHSAISTTRLRTEEATQHLLAPAWCRRTGSQWSEQGDAPRGGV